MDYPLGGFFPTRMFKIAGFALWLELFFPLAVCPDNIAVFQHSITRVFFRSPALNSLNFCDDFVRCFSVESLVDFDDFARFLIHPVDSDMQMLDFRVFVQAIDSLMSFKSHSLKKNFYTLVNLIIGWMLIFMPTHDPMRHGHFAVF